MGQSASVEAGEDPGAYSKKHFGEKPTFQDVKSWSESFDTLMNAKLGKRMLTEFLKLEYADENMMFWQACENLKTENDSEKVVEKVKIIFDDFISILSPKEVSIDSRIREEIHRSLANPQKNIFDDAQKQVYMLMQRDSYPRFLQCPAFRELQAQYELTDV